jgi:hypothetical protein
MNVSTSEELSAVSCVWCVSGSARQPSTTRDRPRVMYPFNHDFVLHFGKFYGLPHLRFGAPPFLLHIYLKKFAYEQGTPRLLHALGHAHSSGNHFSLGGGAGEQGGGWRRRAVFCLERRRCADFCPLFIYLFPANKKSGS